MDIDTTLEFLRQYCSYDMGADAEGHAEFAEHFQALDMWITRGGFLPIAWNARARVSV